MSGGGRRAGRSDRRIDCIAERHNLTDRCDASRVVTGSLLIVPARVALLRRSLSATRPRLFSSSSSQSSSGRRRSSTYPASRPFVSGPTRPVLLPVPVVAPRNGVASVPAALPPGRPGHVLELPLHPPSQLRRRSPASPSVLPSRRLDLLERPLGSLDHLPLFSQPFSAVDTPPPLTRHPPRRRTLRTGAGFGTTTAPAAGRGPDPVEVLSLLPPRAPQVSVLSSFTSTHTVTSQAHVAARCTDARGLPFALSAGGLPMHSKCRHPLVRLCAVQLVPTTLAMSTWFLAWKPPADKANGKPRTRGTRRRRRRRTRRRSRQPFRPGRRHALLRLFEWVDEARTTSGSIRGSVVAVARGADDEWRLLRGYGAADGAARRAPGREDARRSPDREHPN